MRSLRAALLRFSRWSTPDVVAHVVNVEFKSARGLLHVGLGRDGGGVHHHGPLAALQPAGASVILGEGEGSTAWKLLADAAASPRVVGFHVGEVPPLVVDPVLQHARVREPERGDSARLDVGVDGDGAAASLEPAGATLVVRPRVRSAAVADVLLALVAALGRVHGRDPEQVVAHIVEAVLDHALLESCEGGARNG
ncbi:hypothetical protein ON010_g16356 [Phytophthora cinnamomi]|nr:hypothetical protein ON010_g16356 [Phytophthora cinnamomi]